MPTRPAHFLITLLLVVLVGGCTTLKEGLGTIVNDGLGKSFDKLIKKEERPNPTQQPKRVSKLVLQRTELLSTQRRSSKVNWQEAVQITGDGVSLKASRNINPASMNKIAAKETVRLAEEAKLREQAEARKAAVAAARRTLPRINDPYVAVGGKDTIDQPGWDISIVGVAHPGKVLTTPGVRDQAAGNGNWVVVFLDVRNSSDTPQALLDYHFQIVSSGATANCSSPEPGGCRYYVSGLSEARVLYQEKRGLTVLNTNYDKREFAPGEIVRTALVYDIPENGQKLSFGTGISYVDLGASKGGAAVATVRPVASEEITVSGLDAVSAVIPPAAVEPTAASTIRYAEEVVSPAPLRSESARAVSAKLDTEKMTEAEKVAAARAAANARREAEAEEMRRRARGEIGIEPVRRPLPPITEAHTSLNLKQTLRVPGWEVSVIGVARYGKYLITQDAPVREAAAGEWLVVFLEARNATLITQPLFDQDFQILAGGAATSTCEIPESGGCRYFVSQLPEARTLYQTKRTLTVLNEDYQKKIFPAGTALRTALVYDLPLSGQKLSFGTSASMVDLGGLKDVPLNPQALARAQMEAQQAAAKAAEEAKLAAARAADEARRAAEEEARRKAKADAERAAIDAARRQLPKITDAYTPVNLKQAIRIPGWDVSILGVARYGKLLVTPDVPNREASNGDWVVVFIEARNASETTQPLFDYDFQFLASGAGLAGCTTPEPAGCRYFINGLTEARGLYQSKRGLTILNEGYDKKPFPAGAMLRTALVYDIPVGGHKLSFGTPVGLVELGTLQEVPLDPAAQAQAQEEARQAAIRAKEEARKIAAAKAAEEARRAAEEEAKRKAKVEAERAAIDAARRLLPPITETHTPLALKESLKVPGWDISVIGVARSGKWLSTPGAADQQAANGDWVVVFIEARNVTETAQPLFDYDFQFLSDTAEMTACTAPESGGCRYFISGLAEARSAYQDARGLTILSENFDKKLFPAGTMLRTALVYDLPIKGQRFSFGTSSSHVTLGTLKEVPVDPVALAREEREARQAAARAEELARAEEQARRAAEQERKAKAEGERAALEVARRALPPIADAYATINLNGAIQIQGWEISIMGVSRPGKLLATPQVIDQAATQGEWVVVFVEARNVSAVEQPLFDYDFQFLAEGVDAKECAAPELRGCRYFISGLSEARELFQQKRKLTVLNQNYDKKYFPAGAMLRTALVYDLPLKDGKLSFGVGDSQVDMGALNQVTLPPAARNKSGMRSR